MRDDRCMGKQDHDFARRFRALCIEADFPTTQNELGKILGVSGTTAFNYLNGLKLPSMPRAIHFAKLLNVCVEYLLTGRGPKRPAGSATLAEQIDESSLDVESKVAMRAFLNSLDQLKRQASNSDG